MAVDRQGTLLTVHATAAKASDSSQTGTVLAQAKAAFSDLESFTVDQNFRRQIEAAAHVLGCERHITCKSRRASR